MKCVVNGINRLFSEDVMTMYQSILSLTITRATPEDSHVLTPLGGGGGVGILNQRNFLQFSKTSAGTSRFVFKETVRGSLKSRRSCAVSCQLLAKAVDAYCIFDNIDHFGHLGHFDKIFRSSKSHF